jgi:hypothetical protein
MRQERKMKKHVFNIDTDSLANRLVIRLFVDHWKKTCTEWDEQSCPDVAYDWHGQCLIAWEDLLLSGIEKDVSQKVYGALFAIYLAFGIVGYDSFSEYAQQTVQLGIRRFKKAFAIDRIQLTKEQIELLEDVLSFAEIPIPKYTLFLFSEVEKKKPDGFAEIEKVYDDYMEQEEANMFK